MKKICICGHFADGKKSFNGQTIKTCNIYDELIKKYGKENVIKIDTYNWKTKPIKILLCCIRKAKISSDIIILPAHKGVKVFVPLFNLIKKIFKFRLHYIVIGGWLYSLTKNNLIMKKSLQKVDYIYVENRKVINLLKSLGITNLYQMNNFKKLNISNYEHKNNTDKFRCCIFSRIEKEKGINDAIYVVSKLNQQYKFNIKLDIYGKISQKYKNEFEKKININREHISYLGAVDPDKSVDYIEKYDLLIFPTLYYTEGIPGTIIDAFFAGVPILASKWENYDEILKDGYTGFSYMFSNKEDFFNKLKFIIENKRNLHKISKNCKIEANKYTAENSLEILFQNIGDYN